MGNQNDVLVDVLNPQERLAVLPPLLGNEEEEE
jgi:hypothetical protein